MKFKITFGLRLKDGRDLVTEGQLRGLRANLEDFGYNDYEYMPKHESQHYNGPAISVTDEWEDDGQASGPGACDALRLTLQETGPLGAFQDDLLWMEWEQL